MLKQISYAFVIAAPIFSGQLRAQSRDVRAYSILGGGSSVAASVDISNNYWGGLNPNTPGTNWPGFNYRTPVTIVLPNAANISDIQVSCGNDTSFGKTKNKNKALGRLDVDTSECVKADDAAYVYSGKEQWQPAFDTIRWYIEHCYMLAGYDILWNDQFGNIETGLLKDAPEDSLPMRAWLLSVRHLNPADGWYCDVVEALTGTYNGDFRSLLAIDKFLLDNPRCSAYHDNYVQDSETLRQALLEVWADSVTDPKATFDSSVPTMHDLGLDSLLEDAASGVHYEAQGTQIILDARITTNPFPQATSVFLSIGREAYLNISVFDMLGRAVEGAGYAGVFEPGSREIPLDLSKAPPGAYYVRISTANNEVQTLKITKE